MVLHVEEHIGELLTSWFGVQSYQASLGPLFSVLGISCAFKPRISGEEKRGKLVCVSLKTLSFPTWAMLLPAHRSEVGGRGDSVGEGHKELVMLHGTTLWLVDHQESLCIQVRIN